MTEKIETRQQLLDWTIHLIPDPYRPSAAAGASYNLSIRKLEFVSRPLWAVFAMMAGDCCPDSIKQRYMKRIIDGLTPGNELQFPLPTTETRQIAVEMAVYGYGLLACGEKWLAVLKEEQKKYLSEWLYSINSIEFPKCNWYFFLLIVNLGLAKNHMPYSRERMQEAYKWIESSYVGDGWYEDGCPGQRDYYVAFAFHFYSLLIDHACSFSQLKDVKGRAELFAEDFIYYMDAKGRTLPYGRSLTYRFVHSAFWSACAVCDAGNLPPAVLKDAVFRNINYWQNQNILQDGLLSIGYAYPNQYISEDYNAYGSPMWAFKTMVILSLPADHPFWNTAARTTIQLEKIHRIDQAGFLAVTGKDHIYALSGMQYSGHHISQFQSKYGKFCYSTGFGWNMSRDSSGINNYAADNALALSVLGTDQFYSRGNIEECIVHKDYIYSRWNYGTIAEIESFLVPVDEETHLRIHRIRSVFPLEIYEGAFPVFGWNCKTQKPLTEERRITLISRNQYSSIEDILNNRTPQMIRQNPNTNIYDPEPNAIPALYMQMSETDRPAVLGCIVSGNPENAAVHFSHRAVLKDHILCIDGRCINLTEYSQS